jgi:hypothetical protein
VGLQDMAPPRFVEMCRITHMSHGEFLRLLDLFLGDNLPTCSLSLACVLQATPPFPYRGCARHAGCPLRGWRTYRSRQVTLHEVLQPEEDHVGPLAAARLEVRVHILRTRRVLLEVCELVA